MERDISKYSIPELKEALETINEAAYPENKAALERELQARKESGEFDQYIEDSRKAEQERLANKVRFALKMRKAIAVYLVIAALYAFAGIELDASGTLVGGISLIFLVLFLVASFTGGVGLFLGKSWGHWTAVTVLCLQLLKVQFDGFAFSVLSLVGIYVYVAGNGDIGITASFDPGFAITIGRFAPLWFGVNIFSAILLGYLFTAEDGTRQP